jgi:Domain of unknown function (DUF3854)
VITEGEIKALALWQMFSELNRRALVVGIPGVWNWRGRVEKVTDDAGRPREVRGPIPDFGRIEFADRRVWVCFDVNVEANASVAAARRGLSWYLAGRGAQVFHVALPALPGVNGVDDLLGMKGADFVWQLFTEAKPAAEWEAHVRRPPPPMSDEERQARRRVLIATAPAAAADESGRQLPREMSRHADAVSFILVAAECPARFRAFVDAVLGAADGDAERWFDAADFSVGMRARAEADLSRNSDEAPTTFVKPIRKETVEKWTQRARRDFNEWQEAAGLTLVETMPGGKADGRNCPSRYRLPVLRLAAEAYEQARLDPRWKSKPARALRRAAAAAVKREWGRLLAPPRRERFRRPQETPAKYRKLALTYARKLYDAHFGSGRVARADEELRGLAEAIVNKRFFDGGASPTEEDN